MTLQIQNGPPLVLLLAWAADWNAYIEPLRDADSACWTPGNSVATSNHPGGTAIDLNWNSHPFQKRGSLNAAQMATMAEMEAFYEGNVFWAGRWDNPVDEMHSQVGYDTYDQANDRPFPKVQDFINRKIRADGFSTFRRGGTVPPPPAGNQADVLARAAGITLAKATDILPGVVNGLRDSECTNINRIAMWLAQMGHESAGFNATEEYASGAAYEGRCSDLGNCQPGDGVRFKGRSWIQITGRANYTKLSAWAYSKGIVPTPTFFIDDSRRLAEMQYAGLGPAWYWTVARPDINALSDAGDIVAVTQRINGGQNGITARRDRYRRAINLGDQLLTLTQSGDDDFMSALNADEQREVLDLLRVLAKNPYPSRSPLRHLGEGNIDTIAGIGLNEDGNVHVVVSILLGLVGDPTTLALLAEVANADLTKYPDRAADKALATRILLYIATTNPTVLQANGASA
ncbi:M15 family metallopeptidase [Mycolicibacterium canariasense]|uniref:M15 family metallopeptidase n=1 Tax=Mycolicibacterium canariasense TaxID=228230 RepID=UPI0013F4D657|nr:M15 family metallopeptidase [Mycolicibacterium canariasense]MCV7213155.1 M15 family metallopeptidase [Mycolicibacterium canariasense]